MSNLFFENVVDEHPRGLVEDGGGPFLPTLVGKKGPRPY
jgi:hypothetical protein